MNGKEELLTSLSPPPPPPSDHFCDFRHFKSRKWGKWARGMEAAAEIKKEHLERGGGEKETVEGGGGIQIREEREREREEMKRLLLVPKRGESLSGVNKRETKVGGGEGFNQQKPLSARSNDCGKQSDEEGGSNADGEKRRRRISVRGRLRCWK